jgi:acyl-coenzyme A thioesterase PaaI-like protein
MLNESFKNTMYVPLMWFIRPKVITLDDTTTIVKVPFSRRNKNHLGSIYFGVLCTAADIAGGLAAMKHIDDSGVKVSLAFQDFQAKFHKRAVGDTLFTNNQGREIKEFVAKVIESGERMSMPVHILATTKQFGDEPVATMTLTLSLKKKS